MIGRRDARVDGHSRYHRAFFLLGFAFGPGFVAAFTLRPRAMSASVQSQSVRPSGILIAVVGLIFPSASQRLSVLNPTPIFAAACCVPYVFFTITPFPALEGHQFHFQASETIAHIVPALLGQPREVWPVSVSAFLVPHLVQILRNLPGHPIA